MPGTGPDCSISNLASISDACFSLHIASIDVSLLHATRYNDAKVHGDYVLVVHGAFRLAFGADLQFLHNRPPSRTRRCGAHGAVGNTNLSACLTDHVVGVLD